MANIGKIRGVANPTYRNSIELGTTIPHLREERLKQIAFFAPAGLYIGSKSVSPLLLCPVGTTHKAAELAWATNIKSLRDIDYVGN